MKVIVTGYEARKEEQRALLLDAAMEALMSQYVRQSVQPSMVWCGTYFFRESMRRSKLITRMRDWSRCRSRKVRTWKGRRFSFMVDDAWMADRGSL